MTSRLSDIKARAEAATKARTATDLSESVHHGSRIRHSEAMAGDRLMSVSFEKIREGDTVRIEFAPPLKGWVEGEVTAGSESRCLRLHGPGFRAFDINPEESESITVIEPPVREGDVAWFDNHWWAVRFTHWHDGPLVVIRSDGLSEETRSVVTIPSDAVWLVRGGKLTDRVKVSE